MKNYFSQRDAKNNSRLQLIIENDLPSFCEEFFVGIENNTSALTRLNYAYDIRMFFLYITKNISRFKSKRVDELTLSDLESLNGFEIEKFLSYISFYEDKNGNTIKNTECGKHRKLSSISSLVRYFERKEKIKKNPTASVEKPKLRKKEIIRLEGNEISTMLRTVESGIGLTSRQQKYQENTRIRDLAIVALMLGTGIRVSELVGIDLNDCNFEDLSFLVTRKGGSRVVLYFSEEVAGYLFDYYDVRKRNKKVSEKENALFLSLQNKRITARSVENIVKKYSSIATPLKRITPHKLRTTFGTQLYRNTGDIFVVADVLGHSDVNTTRKHYAAMSDDVRRKASSRISLGNVSSSSYLDDDGKDK